MPEQKRLQHRNSPNIKDYLGGEASVALNDLLRGEDDSIGQSSHNLTRDALVCAREAQKWLAVGNVAALFECEIEQTVLVREKYSVTTNDGQTSDLRLKAKVLEQGQILVRDVDALAGEHDCLDGGGSLTTANCGHRTHIVEHKRLVCSHIWLGAHDPLDLEKSLRLRQTQRIFAVETVVVFVCTLALVLAELEHVFVAIVEQKDFAVAERRRKQHLYFLRQDDSALILEWVERI